MFLPKVIFKIAPIEQEVELLYSFSNPNERFFHFMKNFYPDLIDNLSKTKDEKEKINICKVFAEEKTKLLKKEILEVKENFNISWDKINDSFLQILSEHLETKWLDNKNITAYISIVPICPRFLDDYSFSIFYKKDWSEAKVTIAHEILHFLWFKKWLEVFPETKKENFESPNLIWRLSEIIDPIILHCHQQISKIIEPVDWGYQSFVNIKIGEKTIPEYFKDIYKKGINETLSFSEIMKNLWDKTKENEKEIIKF